ncbi:MAG: DUF4249 domain-containing protein [Spirosoma sp.]|nr:DUF4249 domain-containing protein [Spirosoma sp.]
MRPTFRLVLPTTLLLGLLLSCVDPEAILLRGTVDIVVVDGTITDLAEPQTVRLNRSKADPVTGLFGTTPLTKAVMQLVIDSSETVDFHETIDGTYQLPTGFRGRVGHAYQLRFTLAEGRQYVSTQQVMPTVPPIDKVESRFNLSSLPPDRFKGYTSAHDLFITTKDPTSEANNYRWEWKLWQKQTWCRSCVKGVYSVFKVVPQEYYRGYAFVTGTDLYENCFTPRPGPQLGLLAPDVPDGDWFYDYICRTSCWEIIQGYDLNIFADTYTNGNLIEDRRIAQVPYYTSEAGLVDIRQSSLTEDAYRYYKLFQDQTTNNGGIADTPPAAPSGNVRNITDNRENVVGYFTASAVSLSHYWLDKRDTQGLSLGASRSVGKPLVNGEELFYALYGRGVNQEPSPPYEGRGGPKVYIWPVDNRPPTAVCVPSDSRTPFKPEGWRD